MPAKRKGRLARGTSTGGGYYPTHKRNISTRGHITPPPQSNISTRGHITPTPQRNIPGCIAPSIKGSSAWAAAVWQAIAPPSGEIPPGWGRQEDFAKEWELSLVHTRRMLNKAVKDGKLEKRIVVAIGKDGHPHRSPIYGLRD